MNTEIHTTPRLLSLIDEASMRAGNDNRLARMLEATRANVSQWRHGKRSCPIEAQILMAAIADRNVQREIAEAVIEQNANTPRGEKLISALGKGLMGGGALSTTLLLGNDASASSLNVAVDLLRCILC